MPAAINPVLVDRVVEFAYTGIYTPGKDLRYATHVQYGFKCDEIADLEGPKFHLHMYNLAELLEFSTLMAHAHQRIADLLTFNFIAPTELAEFVNLTFAPPGSELRVCADTEGYVQKLVVVATLVQENKYWTPHDRCDFGTVLVHDDYHAFWNLWEDVEADCIDLIEAGKGVVGLSKGKKKRVSERDSIPKRVAAKQGLLERRADALVKFMERMDLDLNEEMI
jgi:hypothetical protein